MTRDIISKRNIINNAEEVGNRTAELILTKTANLTNLQKPLI